MIIIFEQDLTVRDGKWFNWRPCFFRWFWNGQRTWRIGWGIWTISYYPEPCLRSFFKSAQNPNKRWIEKPAAEDHVYTIEFPPTSDRQQIHIKLNDGYTFFCTPKTHGPITKNPILYRMPVGVTGLNLVAIHSEEWIVETATNMEEVLKKQETVYKTALIFEIMNGLLKLVSVEGQYPPGRKSHEEKNKTGFSETKKL